MPNSAPFDLTAILREHNDAIRKSTNNLFNFPNRIVPSAPLKPTFDMSTIFRNQIPFDFSSFFNNIPKNNLPTPPPPPPATLPPTKAPTKKPLPPVEPTFVFTFPAAPPAQPDKGSPETFGESGEEVFVPLPVVPRTKQTGIRIVPAKLPTPNKTDHNPETGEHIDMSVDLFTPVTKNTVPTTATTNYNDKLVRL